MKKRHLKHSLKLNKERISKLTSGTVKGGYYTSECPSWQNCETDGCGTNNCDTGACQSENCNTNLHPVSDPLHCRTCNVECTV